jgi:hypothetical protein
MPDGLPVACIESDATIACFEDYSSAIDVKAEISQKHRYTAE